MTKDKKYKLIRAGKMSVHQRDWKARRFYQLVALRDIPLHNVKAGDLGGYVTDDQILSQEGNCWIGEEAQVIDEVRVFGDAYIGGKSLVYNFFGYDLFIKDNAILRENAVVWIYRDTSTLTHGLTSEVIIGGSAEIYGNANLVNVKEVSGFAKIHGDAHLGNNTVVTGTVDISGGTRIDEGVKILGDTQIFGKKTLIGTGSVIRDCIVSDVSLQRYAEFSNRVINKEGSFTRESHIALTSGSPATDTPVLESFTTLEPQMPSKSKRILAVYNEVLEGIASYETDIVKLIKYPIMSDRTDPYTRNMVKCAKDADYYASEPESDNFSDAVRALEDAYFAAESNALKIASTSIPEEDRKKMEKAKVLLALAANESTSENEKKMSFKQAFKQLEGVVVVPEIAVDTFRVKIGLKELES